MLSICIFEVVVAEERERERNKQLHQFLLPLQTTCDVRTAHMPKIHLSLWLATTTTMFLFVLISYRNKMQSMSWLEFRRSITIVEGLSYLANRSAYTYTSASFFFTFFSFFVFFIHSFILLHIIGGDCVDNDLYSALFFFFFFSSCSHSRRSFLIVAFNEHWYRSIDQHHA
jgi:hypothetical protein